MATFMAFKRDTTIGIMHTIPYSGIMTFCEKLFGTIKKRRNKTTQKRVVRGKPRSS